MSEKHSTSGKFLLLFSVDFKFMSNFKKDLYTEVYMFLPYHGNSSTVQHFTVSCLIAMLLLQCGEDLQQGCIYRLQSDVTASCFYTALHKKHRKRKKLPFNAVTQHIMVSQAVPYLLYLPFIWCNITNISVGLCVKCLLLLSNFNQNLEVSLILGEIPNIKFYKIHPVGVMLLQTDRWS